MMWYGGIRLDELWQKRWRSSLYLSYFSGAGFIYPESSHFEYNIKVPANLEHNENMYNTIATKKVAIKDIK